MPGDQHSFGVLMVEEVFSRAGWQSEVLLEPTRPELLQMVSSRHYDLVGLTLTCDSPTGAVQELITAVRSLSQHPDIRVLIGGQSVNADPDLVERTGADGAAHDARSALRLGEQLVSESRQLDTLIT
jgi:methanogenic corrinoid protein MtbC1